MNNRGFTLVELILAMLIVVIMSGVVVTRFSLFNTKEKISSQAKQIQSDIVSARIGALQQRKRTVLFFGPQQYTYKTYTSVNESLTGGTLVKTVNLPFVLKRKTGATQTTLSASTDCVEFGANGLTDTTNCANANMTLLVTPVTINTGTNCVVVGVARTSIGRMENVSTCRMW
jgi:prepilin-type N-terminal cleavage/methylation domain-containing protein